MRGACDAAAAARRCASDSRKNESRENVFYALRGGYIPMDDLRVLLVKKDPSGAVYIMRAPVPSPAAALAIIAFSSALSSPLAVSAK